jgi:phosphoesterase RecJ-like protein
MDRISEILTGDVKTMSIAGHIKPDGDCTGSCMALYLYVKKNCPWIDVKVYLETPKPEMMFLQDTSEIISENAPDTEAPDLFAVLDVSTRDRIGLAQNLLDTAKKTVCIDHHVSNGGIAEINVIKPEIGSCSEVLYELLDEEKIDEGIAEALFTGIIHDTGVFQYTNTRPETMRIGAALMEKGVPASTIIDETFNKKTYKQNQILGRTLLESMLMLNGKCIVASTTLRDMRFYDVTQQDLDGIVSQMRLTEGVEVAVYIYETQPQIFKVSLRSSGKADVCRIASAFKGGGHVKAAGCTMQGNVHDVINNLMGVISEEINKIS